MGEKYYPTKSSKFIACLDSNNLYAWVMRKALPVGWMDG